MSQLNYLPFFTFFDREDFSDSKESVVCQKQERLIQDLIKPPLRRLQLLTN